MINKDAIKILKQAINKYGAKMYEDMAIEEMSELTKALLKHRRAGEIGEYNLSETRSAIVEELADVEICLVYLKLIYKQTTTDFCEEEGYLNDIFRCSNCHIPFDENTRYCPHCGARMDGD